MGLLRSLLTFPISAPVNSVFWIAGQLHNAALAEVNDPASLRRALVDLEQDLLEGRIDEETYDAAETRILSRLQGVT